MATVKERKGKNGTVSYLIRAYTGRDINGKKLEHCLTWVPDEGMTPKQIEKELQRQATLFEEKVRNGFAIDSNIKFVDYADRWLKVAQLSPKCRERYEDLLKRINLAIGHLRLEKVQPIHLTEFYKNLKEEGVKKVGSYAIFNNLSNVMKNNGISRSQLAQLAHVSESTISTACKGRHVSLKSAQAIETFVKVENDKLYAVHHDNSSLSDKTILHHHRLISSILGQACKEQIIPRNVASRDFLKAPKVEKKEPVYLDDIQAQNMVQLLQNEEDIRAKAAISLLLYSGVRRGELCGLEWGDMDFNKSIIHVRRASQYQKGKGVTEVTTKNESSKRVIKLPENIMTMLSDYKEWWVGEKFKNGDRWQGSNRLFVQDDGKPINPDTINFWLEKFRTKNNLPYFTPHSLRHTFATLQIAAGVPLRTVQSRTGHAQMSTLGNIYAHAIKTADEAAADALENMLQPKGVKKA